MPEKWEMQEDESSEAFQGFGIYRDMGMTRSYRAVADRLGKSESTVDEWRSRWRWLERARAWDAELDQRTREKNAEAIVAMNERHAQIASVMQAKIVERLQSLDVSKLGLRDLIYAFAESAKVERLARGEATSIYAKYAKMSDEELLAYLAAEEEKEEPCLSR